MDKREKRGILAERALARIDAWRAALDASELAPV
jgi:hypothetical protein